MGRKRSVHCDTIPDGSDHMRMTVAYAASTDY
jgi:hypothetical protein